MGNTFTLESMKEATRKQFAPFELELADGTVVALSPLIKLSADDRKAVSKALDEVSAMRDGEDTPEDLDRLIEAISRIFVAICDRPQKLLTDLRDDDKHVELALMTRVITEWAKETQLGEA